MKGLRMNRVDSEIQKSLAKAISNFDDEIISSSLISIMKVETFADLSLSKIYVSVFGNDEKKNRVVAKLNENKKTLRYELAHSIRLRVVPDLLFIVDDFEEKTERVLKLFETIEEKNNDSETDKDKNDEE
ncbi:MAG: 30S ribosome-binding factor RbfA [Clostridia bacterium]|nr:30S ribosome-binding factor RbfA [Clostridia bacterium]